MLRTPEFLLRENIADPALDMKKAEILYSEPVLRQPGAKIADRLIEILGLPTSQWSSADFSNRDNFAQERIIADSLTNQLGTDVRSFRSHFISRDPRHFLNPGLNSELLEAMNPNTAAIFENEVKHRDKYKNQWLVQKPISFGYVRMPGGMDCVLKGYNHHIFYQTEHKDYLSETAKYAQVLVVEGLSNLKYGEGLVWNWEHDFQTYGVIMREAVRRGFNGYFAEVDTRDMSKVATDTQLTAGDLGDVIKTFPKLPEKFFRKYFSYLRKFFPADASRIGNHHDLEKLLRLSSTTEEGNDKYFKLRNYKGISVPVIKYPDEERDTQSQMTGLEYGELYYSDAMSAIKLHLIAKEMREGRMKPGVIVDFEGAAHLESKYFFLRNPLYAMMVALKNPHLILKEQLAIRGDISSIYPAFSPDRDMFDDMFRQTWRLEFARPEKVGDKTEVNRGKKQMPMTKYEHEDRRTALDTSLSKFKIGDILENI